MWTWPTLGNRQLMAQMNDMQAANLWLRHVGGVNKRLGVLARTSKGLHI